MNKRVLWGIFLFLLLMPLVSAQLPNPRDAIELTIAAGKEVFTPLFEALLNTSSYKDFFFAKILLLLLLFMVVFGLSKKIPAFRDNKAVGFTVALVVSLIAVRYISEEGFIAGILLPYGALGIAITSFIPFMIYFWFVHESVPGGFGRRIAWILYGVIFVLVWGTRAPGEISEQSTWIYLLGFIAVAVSFVFDKTLHGYFRTHEMNLFIRGANQRTIASLQAEYLNILYVNSYQANQRRADLERQIRDLGGSLP